MMTSIRLTKSQPEKNIRRYYLLALMRDLFGHVCVVREWGRIGKAGQVRQDAFESEREALKLFERKKREKLKKGYRIEAGSVSSCEEEANRRQGDIQAI